MLLAPASDAADTGFVLAFNRTVVLAAARTQRGYMNPLFFTQSWTLAFYHISDECIKRNAAALSDQPEVEILVALGLTRRLKVSSRLSDAL